MERVNITVILYEEFKDARHTPGHAAESSMPCQATETKREKAMQMIIKVNQEKLKKGTKFKLCDLPRF